MPKVELWNGDESLLRDSDITKIVIDFRARTFSVWAHRFDDPSCLIRAGADFTNVSPFGLCARALRRMVSNVINGGTL